MNIEFEVKDIIRTNLLTMEEKVNKICGFTNFKKKDIINAIEKGGKTPLDVYETLTNLWKKSNKDENK